MLLVVAGVPSAHFNSFQKNAGKLAGTGHSVIGIPSKPHSGGYTLGAADAERLVSDVTKLALDQPGKAAGGIAVIYLAHQWVDAAAFEAHIHPAAIAARLELPAPVETEGAEGRIYINGLLRGIGLAAPRLIRAVSAVRTELENRRNRTPLLLPLRNFSSDRLDDSIRRLARDLPNSNAPHERLREACGEIEEQHPYQPKGPNKGFTDAGEIVFKSPGRDLHGAIWANAGPGHKISCTLNGLFRLGGPIAGGFHYDCVRPPRLTGTFSNCHDEHAEYRGNPHLNIAPNDFVRA